MSRDLKEHLPRLDVMRGIAILFVFFFHLYVAIDGWRIPWKGLWANFSAWPVYSYPLVPMMWGGVLGVPLFFVLSGFCIHYAFLRRGKPLAVKGFYWHRFLRIYPAYFVAAVLCAIFVKWLPYKYENGFQLPVHLLLIHNLNKSTFFGLNGVFWSLGVEFQFYLLYPLLLLARKKWNLPVCFAGSLALNVLFQIYFSLGRGVIDAPVSVDWSFPLITWCDWILGACLAEAFVERRRLFPQWWIAFVVAAVMVVVAQNFKILHCQTFLFSSVFFAVVMDRYLPVTSPLNWLERLIVPVGLVSYSLYLWHASAITLTGELAQYLNLPTTVWTVTFVFLPFLLVVLTPVVVLSYRYLELRVQRFFKGEKPKPDLLAHPESMT